MRIRLVVPLGLRARRAARLARDDRAAGPRAHPRAQRSRGARPPRRAGALARSRRAREPRALGAARGDRGASRPRRRRSKAATIGDIAKEQGKAPFDALLDIVVADELRTGLRPDFGGPEPDETWKMRVDVWRDPRAMIGGSDAGAHLDMMSGASYSTFVVGDAVRNGYLSLEEAVHLHHRQARAPLRAARPWPRRRGRVRRPRVLRPGDGRPDRRAHLRRPARRREPHRRRVAAACMHVLVNGTEIVRDADVHRRDARHRPARRTRHRDCQRSIHGGLMYTHERRTEQNPERRAGRRRRADRRAVLAALRRRPGHRVPRGARAVPGAPRRRACSAATACTSSSYADVLWALQAPRGVLVEGRRRTSATTCR